ncbi:zinc ribbon-containing protein [Phosphitispora fastidiosa]
MAYAAGERPGQGTYYCLSCKEPVKLTKTEEVPTCPKCKNTQFTK